MRSDARVPLLLLLLALLALPLITCVLQPFLEHQAQQNELRPQTMERPPWCINFWNTPRPRLVDDRRTREGARGLPASPHAPPDETR
jgi:hypothetical protein